MSRFLVHVYGSSATNRPIPVTDWGTAREARAWLAKHRELYPELGHAEIVGTYGARQIKEVLRLLEHRRLEDNNLGLDEADDTDTPG
jgi:hypothetical protein